MRGAGRNHQDLFLYALKRLTAVAVSCGPELQSSDTAESVRNVDVHYSSMNVIPSILRSRTYKVGINTAQSTVWLPSSLQLPVGTTIGKHKRSERPHCVAGTFPDDRGEEKEGMALPS